MWGEFGGECIHVDAWLGPFAVHLKLTTLLISYTTVQSFKKCIIFCLFSFKKIKYKFINFNWTLITLQYCIGFATHQHESATGIHMFPILNPHPSSLPVPSLWVVSVDQPQASSIMHQTWTGYSFYIWYYICFNVILPNHATLALSHRVQKDYSIHLCLFCYLAYRVKKNTLINECLISSRYFFLSIMCAC